MFNIFKSSLSKVPGFSFSQNNVFRHACATPLTVLKSNLGEDLAGIGSLSSRKNLKNKLASSLEAVNKLVKIIESTTTTQDFKEKFEVYSAINEVLCLFSGKVDEGCISSRVLAGKDLFLVGSKLYFQEALTCVLNNSIEAYGESGKKPINIILRKMGESLRMDLTDYAQGMNPVMQKIVLLNGVSTKNNGTGLGLYFAKKTVEEIFLGSMVMKSSVKFGTHVAWTIPLVKPCSQNL